MNLKEAFRYQNFLDTLMRSAVSSIQQKEHCFAVTKTHHCNKVNPDVQDYDELVEVDAFTSNDDVISFIMYLIDEKEKLTAAIGKAKASIDFDIDAATEQNKFRQQAHMAIKSMLRFVPNTKIETGYGYKFNVEGNQTSYRYDVEVKSEEAYDKSKAKTVMRKVIADADTTSSKIDAAKINTVVEYMPPFDVNESFDDVMATFLEAVEEVSE